MQQNNVTYLSLAMMYPLFIFLSFFLANNMGGIPPLSAGALLDVFTGKYAAVAILFTILSFADMAWYHFSLFPASITEPKEHLLLLVLPEIMAVFGFLLGFLTKNPWIVLPFTALGFANYAYAFIRINSYAPKT